MKKILLLIFFCSPIKYEVCFAQAGEWTWMNGDSAAYSNGLWGTKGISGPSYTPPSTVAAFHWQDQQGNFWKYSGDYSNKMWKFDPQSNEWAWMSGDSIPWGQPIIYSGYMGIFSANNSPAGRLDGLCWQGNNGIFWLYGGIMMDGSNWDKGDLWKYDPTINQWAWMNHSLFYPATYGTQGIPSNSNAPGARNGTGAAWTDSLGNLWFFGGRSYTGLMNDVWKYNPNTNDWTWMAGSNLNNQAPSYGLQGIASPSNTPGGRYVSSSWKDLDGKFWIFGGSDANGIYSDLWMFDPVTNNWTWEGGSNTVNSVCVRGNQCDASITFTPGARETNAIAGVDDSGRVWMFGGWVNGPFACSDLWMYNSNNNEWAWQSGDSSYDFTGIFGAKGISSPTNKPGAREGGLIWIDTNNNIWLFGGDNFVPGVWLNDLWRYVIDTACLNSFAPSSYLSFTALSVELCEKFCTGFTDQSTNNPTSWQWQFPGGDPSSSTLQNPTNICYNAPGTYDVTLITTNANGSDTLTLHDYITVYATPPIPTITQVGYTLTSSAATSYQWQLNTIDISGATNQSYTILQSGYYTVVVGDSNSCKNSTTVYVLISGVDEVNNGSISISPNPSSGNFTIELLQPENSGEVSIDVINTIGQKVFSSEEKISSSQLKKEIDLSDVAHGIYFIEIKTEKEFVRKKILIAD